MLVLELSMILMLMHENLRLVQMQWSVGADIPVSLSKQL